MRMASSVTKSISSEELAPSESNSTAVDQGEACLQDNTKEKHAVILDINVSGKSNLSFVKPTVDELLWKGPAKVMNEAGQHKADVRWIHLRANCMEWIEELMDRVCEERGIALKAEAEEPAPNSPISRKNPILRKDLYSHLFHGKHSDRIKTRFIGPVCTAFSLEESDEESDGAGSTRGSRDNLVLYMPYMHWESSEAWRSRQHLLKSVTNKQPVRESHADHGFIEKYLHHRTSPYHERRSLDEAYYHHFAMTAAIDRDSQVMEKYIKQHRSEPPKLIVIDQLWLWLIRGFSNDDITVPDLVITAFPDRFNGAPDTANVYRGIVQHLERGLQPPLRKAEDLISTIIEHVSGVFFQRQLEHDKWFLEFFAAAIGNVRQKQRAAFRDFCDMCEELEKLQNDRASLLEVSQILENPAFAITKETSLFREIKDIVDELSRIDYILGRQEAVSKSLTRMNKARSIKTTHDIVVERRQAWLSIAGTAKTAYDEIQSQMDLKQKQSSLSETRSSRYQVEDSARHGRIMLLLTVVAIIFLPLSFMASWFGMNPETPALGNLKLSSIAAIIFPISMIIAGVALAFAFSERLRDGMAELMEGISGRISRGILGNDDGTRRQRRRRRRRSWERRERRSDGDTELGRSDSDES
jgi:Mg2+ and Co2+ transporter CorA